MKIKFFGKDRCLDIYLDIDTTGQEMDGSDIYLDFAQVKLLIKFLQSRLLEMVND